MPATTDVATLVLVHGAGHTSRIWRRTRAELGHPSLAVDLPGRHDRPADITRVTIDAAADSITRDVDTSVTGPVVLVGHSVGGIVLPAVAARLGDRVEHLVFVAGLIASDGERVVDSVRPGEASRIEDVLEQLRRRHAGHVLRPHGEDARAHPELDDQVAMGIDSLNYMAQVVSWDVATTSVPRTFVRCTRDPIQSPELQARLVDNCAATAVVDLDSGHTPALDAPTQLATLLDRIAAAPRACDAPSMPDAGRGND